MGDFGGKLRQARERRGVSLRQIAGATKISVGVLEALERNDVSKLPGGIFSRAFVRSYASEVGLDPDETIRDFVAEFTSEGGAGAPPPLRVAAPVAPRPVDPSTGSGSSRAKSRDDKLRVAMSSVEGRPTDASRGVPKTAPEPGRRTQPSVDIVPDESEFESQQRMASVVLRLLMVSVPLVLAILYFSLRGAPADGTPASRPASEAAPPPPASVEQAAAPLGAATAGRRVPSIGPAAAPTVPSGSPDEQTIELRPGAPCWVSLTVDGSASLTREMQAGEREVRTFRQEAVLKVGDAAACEFALNGRIARRLGGSGQTRTVKITPQNLTSYLP